MRPRNLFSALAKRSPRDGRTPFEDFCTEALAYLLESSPELSSAFLGATPVGPADPVVAARTQRWVGVGDRRGRPDLLLHLRSGRVAVVESKVDAPVDDQQLATYRAWLEATHPGVGTLVLLTKLPVTSREPVDAHIRWGQVAEWARREAAHAHLESSRALLSAFAEFLEEHHMSLKSVTQAHVVAVTPWMELMDRVHGWLIAVDDALVRAGAKPPSKRTRREKKPTLDSDDGSWCFSGLGLTLAGVEFYSQVWVAADGIWPYLQVPRAALDGELARHLQAAGGEVEYEQGWKDAYICIGDSAEVLARTGDDQGRYVVQLFADALGGLSKPKDSARRRR